MLGQLKRNDGVKNKVQSNSGLKNGFTLVDRLKSLLAIGWPPRSTGIGC